MRLWVLWMLWMGWLRVDMGDIRMMEMLMDMRMGMLVSEGRRSMWSALRRSLSRHGGYWKLGTVVVELSELLLLALHELVQQIG